MKKVFTVIRQGKLDEVKMILEKKPELVNCVSGALPKRIMDNHRYRWL